MNAHAPEAAAAQDALRAPGLARIYALEAWSELLKALRTPMFAIPTLVFPAAFYLLFAVVLPGQWAGYSKPAYLLATYGVFGVMGPALFGFGVGMAMERQQGLLELKRVSPMPPGAYFFAKIAMSLGFALAIVLLLTALAVGFGGVRIGLSEWLRLAAALLLGTLPFSALGLCIGTLVRGQGAVAVVNLIHLPMSVLSGLWIPLFVFPELLQKLAVLWPSWHLAQLALAAVGQVEGVAVPTHVGVLLLMTTLLLSLAALRLRRS